MNPDDARTGTRVVWHDPLAGIGPGTIVAVDVDMPHLGCRVRWDSRPHEVEFVPYRWLVRLPDEQQP